MDPTSKIIDELQKIRSRTDFQILDSEATQNISTSVSLLPGQSGTLCNFMTKAGNSVVLTLQVDISPTAGPSHDLGILNTTLNIVWGTSRGIPKTASITARKGTTFSIAAQALQVFAINNGTYQVDVSLGNAVGTVVTEQPVLLANVDLATFQDGMGNVFNGVLFPSPLTPPKYATTFSIQRLPIANPMTITQSLQRSVFFPNPDPIQVDIIGAGASMLPIPLHPQCQDLEIVSGGPLYTRMDIIYGINI